MTFSILFWNIWFRNQVEGKARADRLFGELKRFAEQYEPDFIALCEVTQSSKSGRAAVLEYLQGLGYTYHHEANMVQFNNYWLSGAALSSRHKINQEQNIVISEHGYAAKHGYPGHNKEAISAQVTLPGNLAVKIIVAHPLTTTGTLKDHQAAMTKLNQLAHSKAYARNTILVGDMNEWRLIPGAFRAKVADVMHSRTGSLLHPTWRYNAHRFTPLRANLDYVYWAKDSGFTLQDFKVLSSHISDHRPLLATFRYESR